MGAEERYDWLVRQRIYVGIAFFEIVLVFFWALLLIELAPIFSAPDHWAEAAWKWYLQKLVLFPYRATLTPVVFFFGVVSAIQLWPQIPPWGRARIDGLNMGEYFVVTTLFWLVIFLHLPVATLMYMVDTPLAFDALITGLVYVFGLATFVFYQSRSSRKFSRVATTFTPLFSAGPPAFVTLIDLHREGYLPRSISYVIDQTFIAIQKVSAEAMEPLLGIINALF